MIINKALINAYLDGKLSFSESKELEVYINNSSDAQNLLESLKIERDLIRHLIPESQMNPKEEKEWSETIEGILSTVVANPSPWDKFKNSLKFLS
jgi:hypothetical protein